MSRYRKEEQKTVEKLTEWSHNRRDVSQASYYSLWSEMVFEVVLLFSYEISNIYEAFIEYQSKEVGFEK